jgi:hypothetical protein
LLRERSLTEPRQVHGDHSMAGAGDHSRVLTPHPPVGDGGQQLHVGVERQSVAARKAHPALAVDPLALGELATTLASPGPAPARSPELRVAAGLDSSADERPAAALRMRRRSLGDLACVSGGTSWKSS